MSAVAPEFCPYCGSPTVPFETEGVERLCCPTCGQIVYTNPAPVAVATVIDGDSTLLVRRSRPPHADAWSMPGGYLELDEPMEAARHANSPRRPASRSTRAS